MSRPAGSVLPSKAFADHIGQNTAARTAVLRRCLKAGNKVFVGR